MSSPYMTTAEVAEYLRFTVTSKEPLISAFKWIKRNHVNGVRVYKVGREIRVLRAAVDAVLRDEALERERRQSQVRRQAFHGGAGRVQLQGSH